MCLLGFVMEILIITDNWHYFIWNYKCKSFIWLELSPFTYRMVFLLKHIAQILTSSQSIEKCVTFYVCLKKGRKLFCSVNCCKILILLSHRLTFISFKINTFYVLTMCLQESNSFIFEAMKQFTISKSKRPLVVALFVSVIVLVDFKMFITF